MQFNYIAKNHAVTYFCQLCEKFEQYSSWKLILIGHKFLLDVSFDLKFSVKNFIAAVSIPSKRQTLTCCVLVNIRLNEVIGCGNIE